MLACSCWRVASGKAASCSMVSSSNCSQSAGEARRPSSLLAKRAPRVSAWISAAALHFTALLLFQRRAPARARQPFPLRAPRASRCAGVAISCPRSSRARARSLSIARLRASYSVTMSAAALLGLFGLGEIVGDLLLAAGDDVQHRTVQEVLQQPDEHQEVDDLQYKARRVDFHVGTPATAPSIRNPAPRVSSDSSGLRNSTISTTTST